MEMVLIPKDDLVTLLREVVKEELSKTIGKEEERFLSPSELCNLFNVTLGTVHNWTNAGVLKKYHMGKRRVYYRESEIIAATKTLRKYRHSI